MIKTGQTSDFYPDYVADSVLALRPSELKAAGITHLAFDIDETVAPRSHNALTDEYINFLAALRRHGFSLLVASNSRRDFTELSRSIEAVVVRPDKLAFKPFGAYYKRLVEAAGASPSKIAMIGDRILNDVIGANRAGLVSILVAPYAGKKRAFRRHYLERALRKVALND